MPNVFMYLINAKVSTSRLRAFFEAPEIEQHDQEDGNLEDNLHTDAIINYEVTIEWE